MFNNEIKIMGHHAHLEVSGPGTSSDHGNPYITLPIIHKITNIYIHYILASYKPRMLGFS